MDSKKDSKSVLNIYQRIDLARVEIGSVAKNINITNAYKAVSEADILKAVNEAEHKVGLVSYQDSLEIITQTQPGQGANVIRVKVGMRIVNIDNPEEFIIVYGLGDGIDRGDKACGKAVTYATKYALMKGYKIPTGDDPDYFATGNSEAMATADDIATYTQLIGGEKNVPTVCKKLGVKSLNNLTQKKIRERIEIRQNAIANEEAKKLAKGDSATTGKASDDVLKEVFGDNIKE